MAVYEVIRNGDTYFKTSLNTVVIYFTGNNSETFESCLTLLNILFSDLSYSASQL